MPCRVPDVHGDLLAVERGLVAVDAGHLGGVVHDEAAGAVADDQGWGDFRDKISNQLLEKPKKYNTQTYL